MTFLDSSPMVLQTFEPIFRTHFRIFVVQQRHQTFDAPFFGTILMQDLKPKARNESANDTEKMKDPPARRVQYRH